MEAVKKLVEALGYPVHEGTAYCDVHRQSFLSCRGCESEIGCGTMMAVLAAIEDGKKGYSPDRVLDSVTTNIRARREIW